jgi:hypothetical protein
MDDYVVLNGVFHAEVLDNRKQFNEIASNRWYKEPAHARCCLFNLHMFCRLLCCTDKFRKVDCLPHKSDAMVLRLISGTMVPRYQGWSIKEKKRCQSQWALIEVVYLAIPQNSIYSCDAWKQKLINLTYSQPIKFLHHLMELITLPENNRSPPRAGQMLGKRAQIKKSSKKTWTYHFDTEKGQRSIPSPPIILT